MLATRSSPLALASFAGATAAAAVLGAASTRRSVRSAWYRGLSKPRFQPPAAAFGPVWTALYALMAGSAYRVWTRPGPRSTRALALWGGQLALNAAWSPTFFGARRPRAALGLLSALLPATAAYALAARRVDRPAAAMVAPYVAWTAFALALNAGIVRRNRRTLARR
jgi:tryptophan-rich sensory protein